MMKENSLNCQNFGFFYSLHMKGDDRLSKIEKYFDFSKMDKKNVQNWNAKNVLTDRIFM